MNKNILFLATLFGVNLFLFFFYLFTQQYPLFTILINTMSSFLLLLSLVNIKQIPIFLKNHVSDLLLLLILFFLTFSIYLYKVDIITPGAHLDEITIAQASEQILSSSDYVPFIMVNYGHSTPLLYLTGLSIEWFGRTLAAIRLPSILFGALTVSAFFVLLRLFFNRTLSFTTALLMLFSYPLIVISRMAYEATPSLFFQVITLTLLYLAWKTKNTRYYAAIGLSLGTGLYTYLGFRTFAIIIISILCFLLLKLWKHNKSLVKQSTAIFLVSFFITTTPLFSYSLKHPEEITARTKSLSIFHQGLPANEVIKELGGNIFRLSNVFLATGNLNNLPNGDPDPRRNPSFTTLFDIFTFLLFILGFIFLIIKNKKLLFIFFPLALASIMNDIFSLERIPLGHYYGIGHPNTLRIAGIIPLVYFVIAFGLNWIKPIFTHIGKGIYQTSLLIIVLVIIGINYNNYYNQIIDKNNYNYIVNAAHMIYLADKLNKSGIKELSASPTIINDGRFQYFINKEINIKPFSPKTVDELIAATESSTLVIIDPDNNLKLVKTLVHKIEEKPDDFPKINLLAGPEERWDFILLGKINF